MYMWASLSMGETEMLPPEIPETTPPLGTMSRAGSKNFLEVKKKKRILKKYEALEAVALAQVTWVRTQHLPGLWPTSVHPLPKSIPRLVATGVLFFSAWCLEPAKYSLD